jgi:hypothetical protein
MISLIAYYGPPPMTMDAVFAIIVAGGRAQIKLNIEVDTNILLSTFIY